jgi:dihydroorotate dehydrogenase (NAD+) catalytic subunit
MIDITRHGKNTLTVQSPVMGAAGMMGYGSAYANFLNLDMLGAFVTNPITYQEWSPARSTRVVPLDAGVLVHTGLPNPGVKKIIKEQRQVWAALPIPLIVHLVGTTADDVRRAIAMLDEIDAVAAIELGLNDDIAPKDAEELVSVAVKNTEKPLLTRLPLFQVFELAERCADAGAGALVVAAPPRGTARDPRTGRLVSGRIYGPLVKPQVLRIVGVLCQQLTDIPVIGAGGIHTPQDARDYLDAGATAVQVDAVIWIKPRMLERIARDLSGKLVTKATDAFADEWHPDMGDTELQERQRPNPVGDDAPAQKQP